MKRPAWLRTVAWGMVLASFPVWFSAFAMPFVPADVATRTLLAAVAIGLGEGLFWVGGAVLGAEVMARFRAPKVRTGSSLAGRRVVVVGASGGLGAAIVEAATREGADVVALARAELDLADAASVRAAVARLGAVDHVVCAAGTDVRGPLDAHTDADVDRLLAVNLAGPMRLVREVGPTLRPGGGLVLLGGFADGGLALPFYTVDVATRAGLAAFAEAVNREWATLGHDRRVSWVCPAPADTAAERPYGELWRAMGAPLVPPAQVADVVLGALLSRRATTIMGRSTRLLAWLNRQSPALANLVAVRGMSEKLRGAFGTMPPPP